MLNLFRKRKTEKKYPHLDKTAFFFAKSIIRLQTHIADWLSKYERVMTIPQKKMALVLFCISMSILSGSIFYHAVTGSHTSPSWLQQPFIVIPDTHPLPDSVDWQAPGLMSVHPDTVLFETDSIHH